MPSLIQTIKYGYLKNIQPRRARIYHIASRLLIFLLIALFAEIFIFNFRFWTTNFNKPTDLSEKINLPKTADGRYVVSSSQNSFELKDINQNIGSMFFKLDENQNAQEVSLKINFTDSGHLTYFDSTDYTVGIPEVKVATSSVKSQYFYLHPTGEVKDLKFVIGGKDINYPLYIDTIIINAKYPFSFVTWRFILTLVILYLLYVFRPSSSVYKIKLVDNPIYSKVVIVSVVAVEAAILSFYLLMGTNLVGVASQTYNYSDWDGVSLVNTFEVGGDNAQQYSELAKSFTKGKLYLEKEPPEYLKQMSDPYDKGSRDEMQKKTGEKYLFDVAYYNGHYYVYFGVVPVLIFYLPFYILTGQNFPTAIGVLIMGLLFIIGLSMLLDRFARYHFERVSLGLYLLLQIPMILCSGILYLFKFPTFYSLPLACSICFAVWGLYFWMRARTSNKPIPWFIVGSLCMALIAGCRPQLLLIALVAVPLFWRKFVKNAKKDGLLTKKGFVQFIFFVLPFVVVGLGIMYYNYARFGSVTNFGANYNLTMNDMTQRGMQLSRILPAIFTYFLQPPNVSGVFPYVNPVVFNTSYLGQTIKEVTFGGIFACMPMLWVLFFSKKIIRIRTQARQTQTISGVIIILLASAFIIAILDAQVAGLLQRYYADFSFMILLSAVLLAFILNEKISLWPARKKKLICGIMIALVGISVLYSALTCFVVENGWYGDIYKWAYRDFLKSVMFWT